MEVVSYVSRVLNTNSGISTFTFGLNNVTFPQSFQTAVEMILYLRFSI